MTRRIHTRRIHYSCPCSMGAGSPAPATASPYIEWWADNLPGHRLGVFGAVLVLLGFALQSLQYWVALLNVEIQ